MFIITALLHHMEKELYNSTRKKANIFVNVVEKMVNSIQMDGACVCVINVIMKVEGK